MLEVDPRSAMPPDEQLRQQVTALVLGGALARGARLPAIRQLANDLGQAGGTVAHAYRELESDGVVTTHGRDGTVVSGPPRQPRRRRSSWPQHATTPPRHRTHAPRSMTRSPPTMAFATGKAA